MLSLAPRHILVTSLFATAALAGCTAEDETGTPANCFGDKCDGSAATANDPFKHLGDIETRQFEYIVIGSGAGGGPLAANLARQGHSVLLLEAGKETGGKTEYQVPVLHPTATETPDLAWWYFVDHYADKRRQNTDSKATPEGILYPRGGTLGGSTSINAMITVAPPNSDWDHIATLTRDDSWRASNMAQYFDRVQRWLSIERQHVNADALFDGHLMSVLTGAFKEAADAGLGGPEVSLIDPIRNLWVMFAFFTRDINAETMAGHAEGVYQFPLATKGHRRNGTREYILATVQDGRRFPLRVKTQALVTKIVFADAADADGKWRANGVEFLDGNALYGADLLADEGAAAPRKITVHATKEVIVSAGAFNTPQLLKLSGIGPRDELASFGIETKVDLPGVGTACRNPSRHTSRCRVAAREGLGSALRDAPRMRIYSAGAGGGRLVEVARVSRSTSTRRLSVRGLGSELDLQAELDDAARRQVEEARR